MSGKIPKLGRIPRYLAHVKKTIDPIVKALNRPTGIIVPSSTITARRLPDARVQPQISPGVSIGAGGGSIGGAPGGPYGGNIFVI